MTLLRLYRWTEVDLGVGDEVEHSGGEERDNRSGALPSFLSKCIVALSCQLIVAYCLREPFPNQD